MQTWPPTEVKEITVVSVCKQRTKTLGTKIPSEGSNMTYHTIFTGTSISGSYMYLKTTVYIAVYKPL